MLDGVRINGVHLGRQYISRPNLSAGGVAFYAGSGSKDPSVREAESWIDAVVNNKDPFVLPEQAYAVSQILSGIYESSQTGNTVFF